MAVMLPMFVAAIDQTLLATATPAIAKKFGELRDTTWIALGYLIAGTITIPLYGRLGDRTVANGSSSVPLACSPWAHSRAASPTRCCFCRCPVCCRVSAAEV